MSRRQANGYHAQSPEAAPLYDDEHRAFLQAFFCQSVFTIEKLKPVVSEILSTRYPERPRPVGDITEQTINSLIQATNAKLASFDFEIRSTRDQKGGERTCALVNTASDTFTQLATSFTPDEIAYIKRLLDAMFEENNTRTREIMAVKKMRATQLATVPRGRQSEAATQATQMDVDGEPTQAESNVKNVKYHDAERVIQDLIMQGFFRLSRNHYLSLAPRGLLELRNYLKETYNEPPAEDDDEENQPIIRIRDCEGCQEIVTVGLRCDNRDCGVRWHTRCANQFFGGQQGKRCPKCKTDWTGSLFVGEKADQVHGRGSTAGRSSRGRTQQDEDEMDEDDLARSLDKNKHGDV